MTEYVREINGVLKDHQDMWDVTELITETGELAGASCLQVASAFSLGIDAEAGRPGRTILQIVRYPHDLRVQAGFRLLPLSASALMPRLHLWY